jgi:hypothetical protein
LPVLVLPQHLKNCKTSYLYETKAACTLDNDFVIDFYGGGIH